jgi:DNA repair protein RadC
MDLKTISRYINYNFVAQAITNALGGTRGRTRITGRDQRFGQFGSVGMQTIGALPVGLKFKLNGVQFRVGFTYELNGNILLDLFCADDGQSGLFDLTKKIYADRARDFLIIHAQLPFDDKVNRKNAQQIINEIAKEVKKANPAIKKQKPRVKPPIDDGERAPGDLSPEAIKILHSTPRERSKILKRKPTPPTPPVKKPDPENINILTPGKPTKIQRMNNRGFDVVEKRSITYTKKSPGKKLAGIGGAKPYKKNIRTATTTGFRIYVDMKKIKSDQDPAVITIDRTKYLINEDRDGAFFIYHRRRNEWAVACYLYDYKTGRAITEHYFDDMMNGTGKAAAKVGTKSYSATGKKKPSAKQMLARAKFAEMARDRAAAKKVNGLYKQRPERIVSGINDKNWWAGFGKIPASGKVNFILMPTERTAKKIEALTMLSYVPRIKISITKGKQFDKLEQVTGGASAAKVIRKFFTTAQLETQEYGGAIFMDKRNVCLGCYVGFIGGIDSAVVDPRLVFGAALEIGATGIILFHNHPSGQLRSSEADRRLTTDFQKAAKSLQIVVLDHIILTARSYFSMAENGEL